MSLRSLCRNYCTIVSNEFAGVDREGAVDRNFSYGKPVVINLRCNIQGRNRQTAEIEFGRKQPAIRYVFYHFNYNIIIGEDCLILTALDFRQALPNTVEAIRSMGQHNLKIFEFKGHRNPVGHKRKNVPLEIHCEENSKWVF